MDRLSFRDSFIACEANFRNFIRPVVGDRSNSLNGRTHRVSPRWTDHEHHRLHELCHGRTVRLDDDVPNFQGLYTLGVEVMETLLGVGHRGGRCRIAVVQQCRHVRYSE